MNNERDMAGDRRVDLTYLPDEGNCKIWISTVRLHFACGWGGPPLYYETMVFNKVTGNWEDDHDRYETLEEAEEGHKQMVEKWSKKL